MTGTSQSPSATSCHDLSDDSHPNNANPACWQTAALSTISALSSHNLPACLFGSAACALYGMKHREPEDIDIIVLTDRDPEEIKALLVSLSTPERSWVLVPSKNPHKTHHVLWFSDSVHDNDSGSDEPETQTLPQVRIKVDILVPGLLGIPPLPLSRIVFVEVDATVSLPVVPLLCLIFLKLRGWTDHLSSQLPHLQEKTWVDEEDIDEMIELAVNVFHLGVDRRTADLDLDLDSDDVSWMPEWFFEKGMERVEKYATAFPDSIYWWTEMGFEIDEGEEIEEGGSYDGYYYDD